MRYLPGRRHDRAHLVTEAQRPMSADISYRERRYLIMMAVRLACFIAAIVVYANGGGWLALIPAVGAVVIPYVAVVFANGGREPGKQREVSDYQPRLPAPRAGPGALTGRPTHIVGFVTYGESEHSDEADAAPSRGSGTGA